VDAADLLAAYTGDALILAFRLNRARVGWYDANEPGGTSVVPFTRE